MDTDEFEIIYLSPGPHAYIRIGGNLYSFSSGFVEKLNWYEAEQKNDLTPSLYGNSRHVRFKTNVQEVAALRDYLEDEVGKAYLWVAPYYTCVSASHRAITKNTSVSIPMGIDRSPALTEGYFKLKKMMGDESISAIQFHPYSDSKVWKAADVFSSIVDALLYSYILPEAAIASMVDELPNSIRITPKEAEKKNDAEDQESNF